MWWRNRENTAPRASSAAASSREKSDVLWEHRSLTIPLKVKGRGNVMQMAHRLDPIVREAIAAAAMDGWRSEEPANLVWLAQHGRVRTSLDQTGILYESVTVHLKRPARVDVDPVR